MPFIQLFSLPAGFDPESVFRVSPPAMVFQVAAALAIFSMLASRRKVPWWVPILGTGILLSSMAGLLRYAYGTPLRLFGEGGMRPPALPGTLAAVAFGLALVWAGGPASMPMRWFVGSSVRARMLRLFAPSTLLIIALDDLLAGHLLGALDPGARGAIHTIISLVTLGAVVALMAWRMGRVMDQAIAERTAALETANQALRLNQRLLEATWQSALDGMRLTDESGRIVKANDAYCALMELPRRQLEGHPMASPYLPQQACDILAKHQQRFRERSVPPRLETSVTLINGRRLTLDVSNSFIEVPGNPPLLMTVYRDVTVRNQIEADHRNQENRLRRALDAARMVTWELDAAERKLVYSHNMNLFVGGDAIAPYCSIDTVLQEIHPEDRPGVSAALETALTRGGPFEREYRARMLDGTYRWILGKGQTVVDAQGKVTGILGVSVDITDRKRMESEITQIRDCERQRIGHELHDGLAGFLGGIAFRAKSLELALGTEARHLAEPAHEIMLLINDSIAQIRAIARGLAPMDLVEHDVWSALGRLARDTSKVFRVECGFLGDAPLPNPNPTISLHLYRIAQEAVRNAIQHGGARSIQLRARVQESELLLEIRDNGTGAARDTSSEEGLGLRIMQHRARAIGATLEADLHNPDGATVCCHLRLPSLGLQPNTTL